MTNTEIQAVLVSLADRAINDNICQRAHDVIVELITSLADLSGVVQIHGRDLFRFEALHCEWLKAQLLLKDASRTPFVPLSNRSASKKSQQQTKLKRK